MERIGTRVVKREHEGKVTARSLYVADYPMDGVLSGRLLRASIARGRVVEVEVPPLPEGYYYVDARDVPGKNSVHIILDDVPVFSEGSVSYYGEPIAMLCGPDETEVLRLRDACRVRYEEQEPVLDFRRAEESFSDYEYGRGDTERAFAEADRVFCEEFETGYQEHACLEPLGMMAVPEADGRLLVHGSMQCAWSVHDALVPALGCGKEDVHVQQDVTGGGFGGKETFPSALACQVAVAARKTGRPVRCVFDRREDMAFSPKRHPSVTRCRMAVRSGRVTALEIDIRLNAGAYATLSGDVLELAIGSAPGVYAVENLRVRGRAIRTNTPPCDAFRGFGAPQACFAIETMMSHAASELGQDPLAFKQAHLVRQGDLTPTDGVFHDPVPLPALIRQVTEACDYSAKRKAYRRPQTGRFRRGIGLSLWCHGGGLDGETERLMASEVRLRKYADGRVEILAASGDIGQGIHTTLPKIVAREMNIPPEQVIFRLPDTARVPNSGTTSASRNVMVVGELVRRAAADLKTKWIDGREQEAEARYAEPEDRILFDLERFHGDLFAAFSWAAWAVEAEIDTLTGVPRILGVWSAVDVGQSIDDGILAGQLEGGVVQGLGYAFLEKMTCDDRGRIRDVSFSDYLIPTAADIPELKCMLHEEPWHGGPFGAKGAGEIPLVGAPAAYIAAVEQAMGGAKLHHLPFTAEDILLALEKESSEE